MRPKKVALSTDCGYMEKGGEENREAAQSKKKKYERKKVMKCKIIS